LEQVDTLNLVPFGTDYELRATSTPGLRYAYNVGGRLTMLPDYADAALTYGRARASTAETAKTHSLAMPRNTRANQAIGEIGSAATTTNKP